MPTEVRYSAYAVLGFGLSSILWKSMSGIWVIHPPVNLVDWLIEPRIYGFMIAYGGGFAFSQVALTRGRALFVIPFSAALGAALPILAGAFVFHEPFPLAKILATAMVILGSLLFVHRQTPKAI